MKKLKARVVATRLERFNYHKSAGGSLEAKYGHSTLNSRHRIWSLIWYCILLYVGYVESEEADKRFLLPGPAPNNAQRGV